MIALVVALAVAVLFLLAIAVVQYLVIRDLEKIAIDDVLRRRRAEERAHPLMEIPTWLQDEQNEARLREILGEVQR